MQESHQEAELLESRVSSTDKEPDTGFFALTSILEKLESKQQVLPGTAMSILKEFMQSLVHSDKKHAISQDFSFFLRRLRRDVLSSASLTKCNTEEASVIL